MANIDAAFGFKPIRHFYGSPWNGACKKYFVEATYGTAIFVGDPVTITGAVGVSDTLGHYISVGLTTAETDARPMTGIVVGVEPLLTDLSKTYNPALTAGYVYVCVDPTVVYAIQDDAGATLTGASIGANCLFASGTGSTVTGLSAWELDASTTPTADASYQGTILGVHNKEGNALGVNCIWEVLISTTWNYDSSLGI